jgi:hypothetical protein
MRHNSHYLYVNKNSVQNCKINPENELERMRMETIAACLL